MTVTTPPAPSGTPDSLIRSGRAGVQGSVATGIVTVFLSITGLHLTAAAIGGLITLVTALVSLAQNYLEDHKGLPALFYGGRGTVAAKDASTANTESVPPGPMLKPEVAAAVTVAPPIDTPPPVSGDPLAPPVAVDPAEPAPPVEPFTPYY